MKPKTIGTSLDRVRNSDDHSFLSSNVVDRLMQMTVNTVLSRSTMPFGPFGLSSRPNSLDVGNRDLDKECGYLPYEPTIYQYKLMYDQEGTAKRIVSVLAEESWSLYPTIKETEDTKRTSFDRAWDDFEEEIDPFAELAIADEISGIASFGIVLIGFNDGLDLAQPVRFFDESRRKGGKKPIFGRVTPQVLYLRPFSQDLVTILAYETNSSNPRYGQPLLYGLRLVDPTVFTAQSSIDPATLQSVTVHWTRVLHIADGCKSSKIFGTPRLRNLHRRVFDIRKILGSSAEMFYKGGFPGISFETDPSLVETAEIDMGSLKKEIEAYSDGLQRYMRLVGMQAKSLAPQVKDPKNHLEEQYTYICATLDCPMNVFLGPANAHDNPQNTFNWHRRLSRRQKLYINPKIIKPLVWRLQDCAVLPLTNNGFISNWKDLNAITDKDKADIGLKQAQAILQYVTSGSAEFIPPTQFLTKVMQFSPEEADAIIKAAGGEEAIIAKLKATYMATAGNTPNTTGTDPTASTGAGGRRNSLGRGAKNKTRSRNGGNAK